MEKSVKKATNNSNKKNDSFAQASVAKFKVAAAKIQEKEEKLGNVNAVKTTVKKEQTKPTASKSAAQTKAAVKPVEQKSVTIAKKDVATKKIDSETSSIETKVVDQRNSSKQKGQAVRSLKKIGKGKEPLEKTPKKKRVAVTLLASFIFPFIIFIATPALVYGNNLDEFLFSWYDFIPMCSLLTLAFTGILFGLIFFLPERGYRNALHILLAFDFLIFIQTTYLNGTMSLAGDNMGGGVSLTQKIINLAIWIVVFVVFIVLANLRDKKKYIRSTSLILCVVVLITQFISAVTPIAANDKFFMSKAEREGGEALVNYATYKNIDKYSTTGNIYYFVVDRFDEDYAEEMAEYDPDFFADLTGFTWFQDTIALYGHTFPSMAYLLTGIEYSCDKNRVDYYESVYSAESSYLKELNAAGYDINLYSDSFYAYTSATLPDYIANKELCEPSLKSNFLLSLKMLELGSYVGVPLFFKTLFNNVSTSAFDKLFTFRTKAGVDGYASKNDSVWSHVQDLEFTETTNKQFNLIHMEGCHEVESSDPDSSKSSITMLKKSFKVIDVFIDNLKEKGLYDDATIIITGDHAAPHNNITGVSGKRQMAVFFKPSQTEEDSKKALKKSQAKVEQKNIMPTIFESIGVTSELATRLGDKSLYLTNSNERKYIWHTYFGNCVESIYKVTGPGNDYDNWKLVSKKTYNRNIMD